MRPERSVVAQARSVLVSPTTAPAGDTGYLVYVVVLVIALVAIPAAVAIVPGLAESPVVAVLTTPDSYRTVGVVSAVLAAAALLAGRTRGIAVPGPFVTEFLAGSDLPLSLTLRRSFLVSATVLACSMFTVAALVVGALFIGGRANPLTAGLFALGCLAFSILLAVLWLMGQSLPRPITASISLLIVATSPAVYVDALAVFTPWGWVGLLWQAVVVAESVLWWPLIALTLSILGLIAVPALLNALRPSDILRQSRRWQSVGTLVQTGDVVGASGALRDPPAHGRRLRMSFAGPLPLLIVQRDITAARRFPSRMSIGSVSLVGAGWLIAMTAIVPDGVGWLTAFAGASLAYQGVGVWCDGLRNASNNAGPGSLYGRSTLTMIGCHALVPGLAAIVFGSLGSLASGEARESILWWILLAVFIVLVRVLDCLKGPMPIGLLLPIPTPVGDVSILNAIAWQADALLIVLVFAGGLTVHFFMVGVTAALWLSCAVALVVALALRRIRAIDR